MLKLIVPKMEYYDEERNEFINIPKDYELSLEHSLISLSKWESKWCKPFLSKGGKSLEETHDYIKCMSLTPNIPDYIYENIPSSMINTIMEYIEAPMTATTFSKDANRAINNKIITSEVIYYWMVALTIPFECQKWHLNRLLTLINVCNIMNKPPKKMSKRELLGRNKALNDARRKQLKSKG